MNVHYSYIKGNVEYSVMLMSQCKVWPFALYEIILIEYQVKPNALNNDQEIQF